MQREYVRSSNIQSIGYDSVSRVLEVEFTSGDIYQYFDIPESVYKNLMQASSHGRFFSTLIKDKFRYIKI